MGRTLEQLIADEKPEVVAKAQALAADIMLNIHLAELREKVQKTQVEMAQALGIRQPTVAVMEKPGRDLKLSSLKRYVEGGRRQTAPDIELPDGSLRVCAVSANGRKAQSPLRFPGAGFVHQGSFDTSRRPSKQRGSRRAGCLSAFVLGRIALNKPPALPSRCLACP